MASKVPDLAWPKDSREISVRAALILAASCSRFSWLETSHKTNIVSISPGLGKNKDAKVRAHLPTDSMQF